MPRGFSTQTKSLIRERLLAHGRHCLATVGVKKTSVEELAAAAGISKGAFYAFFASKEELFLAILAQYEQEYQASLLAQITPSQAAPTARLTAFIQHATHLWRTSPLFHRIDRDTLMALTRHLSDEQRQALVQADEQFAERVLARWRATGLTLTVSASELTGLLRALFFVGLHADDIGAAIYPTVQEHLVRLVAGHLVDQREPPP